MYKLLFGHVAFESLPSSEPRMKFVASNTFHDYIVHFSLNEENNQLSVKAMKDGRTWDLVPLDILREVLPYPLLLDHVFWYCSTTSTVILRPRGDAWTEKTYRWTMSKVGDRWGLQHTNGNQLVFPATDSANRVSAIFKPIESKLGLSIFFKSQTSLLHIHISRLQLEFTVKHRSDKIQSCQYKDMCVDKNQGIGTLIGLQSKLVLCGDSDPDSRMIIVPDDEPGLTRLQIGNNISHPCVMIADKCKSIQKYILNTHLGQLRGNGSLKSRLFLAELHALTASCVPDPFTGHTGTEEALDILNSAAVSSLEFTTDDEGKILQRILRLSPRRMFYPKSMREMQQVHWKTCLSPLSQSDLFFVAVRTIFEKAQELHFFREPPNSVKNLFLAVDDQLVARAIYRAPFVTDLNHQAMDTNVDVEYTGKLSCDQNLSERTSLAVRFGVALRQGSSMLLKVDAKEIITAGKLWQLMEHAGGVEGANGLISGSKLGYDAILLDSSHTLIISQWCKLHRSLIDPGFSSLRLVPWLAALAFSSSIDVAYAQTMLAFANAPAMREITLPMNPRYDLSTGCTCEGGRLFELLKSLNITFEESDEGRPSQQQGPWQTANDEIRRQGIFNAVIDKCNKEVVETLCRQWPAPFPSTSNLDWSYFQKGAEKRISNYYQEQQNNFIFHRYLDQVTRELQKVHKVAVQHVPLKQLRSPYLAKKRLRTVNLVDLLSRVPPPAAIPEVRHGLETALTSEKKETPDHELMSLTNSLRIQTSSRQETLYLDKLDESISCLQECYEQPTLTASNKEIYDIVVMFYKAAAEHHDMQLKKLRDILGLGNHTLPLSLPAEQDASTWQVAAASHQWPRLSTRRLLSLMKFNSWPSIPGPWKPVLVAYAVSITNLQAAERLCNTLGQSKQDLIKELGTIGPRLWSPLHFPDSLLLEVESNIRIRRVQDDIAVAMRYPPGDRNAVMQLNMGEGKSSVIVPIVAASLADGSRLVRIIVAKPQSRQMFEILLSKLGGLIGRRIYQFPFARTLKLTHLQVQVLEKHFTQCAEVGGVILVQPEHILSFQLMAIEVAITAEKKLAGSLWRAREFLEAKARDIVDESDENFSTKFELIYTMGVQRPVEHGPDRWIVIQQVLGIVVKYARTAHKKFPRGIELDDQGRLSFPLIRFLTQEASDEVLREAMGHICRCGIHGFPASHKNQEMRSRLLAYVLDTDVAPEIKKDVEASHYWSTFSDNLLLLRGLFGGGILEFVFKNKRWRVNYGLDASRVPTIRVAVPFRAKDSPSIRSEFSHPDVVICLTCLSYYYGGLSDENQMLALQHLLRSDQAEIEFQEWVDGANTLPEAFRHVKRINLEDKKQCRDDIFPHFRHSKGAVDYFLSHIVFTKEMREFPSKLSASGWDIGRKKPYALTGFSGTNDSQNVLPVTVTQIELAGQKHTNALVLGHLMRPENSVVSLTELGFSGICKSQELLKIVTSMNLETRVVLDVGALVLDMTNEQFAQEWLNVMSDRDDIQAAVFCNSIDEVCVLDRRGHVEPLTTSPFAGQLDQCVAFLDEAHTRGIDLRLPTKYRAAVTLGANLTKDRLVQGNYSMTYTIS